MTTQRYHEGLTAAQEVKIEQLRELVADAVSASPSHQAFCTRGTYVRYLRARDWNVSKAAKMLAATLAWRSTFNMEQLRWERLKEESADGKLAILDNSDKAGRPIVLMRPRNEERYTGNNEERMQWLVYTLETACQLADRHAADGKMTWLIDFVGYTRKHQPPLKVTMGTLSILQNHYPERLGLAVCYQPPLLFDLAWKVIKPFVDPVTNEKLVFLHQKDAAEKVRRHFDPDHIDETIGGTLPIAQLWSYERYEQRMVALEAEAAGAEAPEAQEAQAAGADAPAEEEPEAAGADAPAEEEPEAAGADAPAEEEAEPEAAAAAGTAAAAAEAPL